MKMGSESIETIMRRWRILFPRFVARRKDRRLSKYVMIGELIEGADCVGGQEKEWVSSTTSELSRINADEWTTATQDERE